MTVQRTMAVGVDKAVALQAAQWFVLLQSGEATAADRTQWTRWRAADPAHEAAWQRAEQVSGKFGRLPGALSMPVLGRAVRSDRRTAVKALAVLLTAAPAGWLAWRASPAREWLADHRTATGERRELRLADGTRLQLNTATAIDVAYGATQRLVRLHAGEILIETAPDAVPSSDPGYRPFIVETAQGRLRALGTRFVVRQHEGDRSHLTVLDGAVEVRPDHARSLATVVRAGEQAMFSSTAVGEITAADADADDWSRGVLRARNMRLHDFLAELGRYRPGVLRCDPAVADLRVSGVFQLRDTGPVLDSLPQALPVDVLFRTRYWVTVVAPGG
ncbi:transmembrane sensor [Variovorax boronicumulans]|uniref:FecR domain-containing protein n=1 Tax=Variovorax boronicumulans TaxID=436515 RepID=UPI002787B423|nr:FecR domain-containing protein [Variovorax boronicumulans]MDP9908447.1 transmembrane sensor [Variovorax boronicumulans]